MYRYAFDIVGKTKFGSKNKKKTPLRFAPTDEYGTKKLEIKYFKTRLNAPPMCTIRLAIQLCVMML